MKVLDRWAVYYPFRAGVCLRNSCSTTELHRRWRGIVAERRAPHGLRAVRIAPLCAEVRGG